MAFADERLGLLEDWLAKHGDRFLVPWKEGKVDEEQGYDGCHPDTCVKNYVVCLDALPSLDDTCNFLRDISDFPRPDQALLRKAFCAVYPEAASVLQDLYHKGFAFVYRESFFKRRSNLSGQHGRG